MNYNKACSVLEISQKHLHDDVRRAYFKLALRYHPDKYKDDNGEKFKEIKEAYDFLCQYNDHDHEKHVNIDENIDYKELIKMCIKYFSPENNWDNLFVDTSLQGILKDCESISVSIFEKLNKDRAQQVFDFFNYYNNIFDIDKNLLEKYRKILQKKCLHDNIIILNPTIDDLFNDNIYKLKVKSKEYYVPLWHHELYFTLENKDLIVKCEPDLSNNMWIDDKNNLYISMQLDVKSFLTTGFYEFNIGEKNLKIDGKELRLTKEKQMIVLFNQGILRINESHMYDDSARSNIYVEINLRG